MRSLLKILCYLHALSYIRAETDNQTSQSPMLRPSIVEKTPFNVNSELNFILKAKDNKNFKDAADRLLNMTFTQRQQIVDLWNSTNDKAATGFREVLNEASSGNKSGPFDHLLLNEQTLLGNLIQSSLDRKDDYGYLTILCTSSRRRLEMLNKQEFTVTHNEERNIEKLNDFIDDKLGSFGAKAELKSLLSTDPPLRPEGGTDPSKTQDQVKLIPTHYTQCNHYTEKKLLKMMTKESFDQIKAVNDEFGKNHPGKSIVDQFDKHCTGKTKQVYKRIAMYAIDPFGYFADEFQVGLTNPKQGEIADAVAIVATRSEIDMEGIKDAYQVKYKKPLLEALAQYNTPNDLDKYIIYGLYRGNRGK